jgi:hypothetical protein
MSIYQFYLFVKFSISHDWRTAYLLAKVVSFLENNNLKVNIQVQGENDENL